jgi:uncharacterized protein YjbJ (UPF0337 family)
MDDKKSGTGAWDKIKGKTNEAIGDLRGDEAQRKRGEAQRAKGEYEQKSQRALEEERRKGL